MLEMPTALSFKVTINLTSGSTKFSFSTIDPSKKLSEQQLDLLHIACNEAVAGVAGLGLTMLARSKKVEEAVTAKLNHIPAFSGVGWEDPNGWIDFNKRAPE